MTTLLRCTITLFVVGVSRMLAAGQCQVRYVESQRQLWCIQNSEKPEIYRLWVVFLDSAGLPLKEITSPEAALDGNVWRLKKGWVIYIGAESLEPERVEKLDGLCPELCSNPISKETERHPQLALMGRTQLFFGRPFRRGSVQSNVSLFFFDDLWTKVKYCFSKSLNCVNVGNKQVLVLDHGLFIEHLPGGGLPTMGTLEHATIPLSVEGNLMNYSKPPRN